MDNIRDRLVAPALGLAVTGTMTALGPIVLWLGFRDESTVGQNQLFLDTLHLIRLGPLFGLPLIWGAYLMLRLEAHWFVKLCCILAVLPVGLGSILGLPVGFWGLAVLARHDVESAFRRHAMSYRVELEQALDDYDKDLRG